MENSTPINSREDLFEYLQVALQLEHATIPPYISALYSIHPGTNLDAQNILRVVAIEEMLHLTLAANLLNAVGGAPDLVRADFVPSFPTYLPTGQDDFEVGLLPFSPKAIETFLNIERPAEQPASDSDVFKQLDNIFYIRSDAYQAKSLKGTKIKRLLPTFTYKEADGSEIELHFHSIGEFYEAIKKGIISLCEKLGEEKVFSGDASRQVTPEYYYSGGGEIHVVTDLESAIAAIDLISEQGEGLAGGIYDTEGELSHFYRYEQLKLKKYYQKGDKPHNPSGGAVKVDFNAVYPIKANAKIEDYAGSVELTNAAKAFNGYYKDFLAKINEAFNGHPHLLIPAIGGMFQLKEAAQKLIKNPIPGSPGTNAAPTFQMDEVLES